MTSGSRAVEAVLDLVPELGGAQAGLDDFVQPGATAHPRQARAVGEVVVDRPRERLGRREDHADAPPDHGALGVPAQQIRAVEADLAVDLGVIDVDREEVDGAEDRRLAAAGRPDERVDRVRRQREVDVPHRGHALVAHAQRAQIELWDRVGGARPLRP